MGGEIEREGSVASFVFAKPHPVDPNCRGGHDSFEIDEDALSLRIPGHSEAPSVQRHELIVLLIEAMPRQTFVGMRHDNTFKTRIVKSLVVSAFYLLGTELPAAIDRKNRSASASRVCRVSEDKRNEVGSGDECGGVQEEIASIHNIAFVLSNVVAVHFTNRRKRITTRSTKATASCLQGRLILCRAAP